MLKNGDVSVCLPVLVVPLLFQLARDGNKVTEFFFLHFKLMSVFLSLILELLSFFSFDFESEVHLVDGEVQLVLINKSHLELLLQAEDLLSPVA